MNMSLLCSEKPHFTEATYFVYISNFWFCSPLSDKYIQKLSKLAKNNKIHENFRDIVASVQSTTQKRHSMQQYEKVWSFNAFWMPYVIYYRIQLQFFLSTKYS